MITTGSTLDDIEPDGPDGEPPDPAKLLHMLDRTLGCRAAGIEAELKEISLVRKLIALRLTPRESGFAKTPPPSDIGGASMGQTI